MGGSRSQSDEPRILSRWRKRQVAQHALVRSGSGVMVPHHPHRGRQYQHDQHDRNENTPNSGPVSHFEVRFRSFSSFLMSDRGIYPTSARK